MSNKITIIGSGSVGATIAYTMTVTGLAAEIVMIDINVSKSLGEALDIRQGTPFCDPVSIYAGSYEDAVDSDIVVITSGVARKPGQSRLELAQKNVDIMKSVIPQITKYAPDAIYVLVANPVDILTYQFYKYSDIPNNHILGSGTLLDTARLRARLSEYYSLSQKAVHAYVLGEHGDSSFVPWSLANISNIKIDDYKQALSNNHMIPDLDHDEVENYIRKSGGKIIQRKGATFFAVAVSVTHLCKSILSGSDSAMSVSTMMDGEYGIEDVCLSILTIIGRDGVEGKLEAPLTDEEVKSLQHSAQCLKDVIAKIDFE